MKRLHLLVSIIAIISVSVFGQDSDLPGQDFDLEALPGIIETVGTFEDLEKAINSEGNEINNLDLDKNGEVDYIMIQEEEDGKTHIAFLRIAVGENEYQDIASIEMEKVSETTASFQIVGDEAFYGKDYILEPEGGVVDISDSGSGSQEYGGKSGPSAPSLYMLPVPAVRVTICVGVYRPGYRVWVSPWGFRRHPTWFRPWRPVARSAYRTRTARWHRSAFNRTKHRRSHHARNMHKKHHRSSSAYKKNNSPAKATPHKATPQSNTKPKSTAPRSTSPSTQQKKKGATSTKKRR